MTDEAIRISREVQAQLTAPGAQFEVVDETVDGIPMKVYASRFASLRQVAELAELHGEAEFVVHGERRYTFTEFLDQAKAVSSALVDDLGVGKGDRVAVLSQNNPEWALTFWGTVAGGAVLVGLNGWWSTDEVLYGLQDSGSRVLVADRRRFERVAEHLDEAPDLETVVLVDCSPADVYPGGNLPERVRLMEFDALLGRAGTGTAAYPDVPIDEGDHAVIFYTSGTTGRSKGAISTHRSMVANLQNTVFRSVADSTVRAELGISSDGVAPGAGGGQMVALFTSPLFHVSGCHSTMVVGLLGGVRLVMVEGRFTPEAALELIQAEQVRMWATVPTMVWRVCEHPGRHDYDTSSVRSVSFGGSPSADELRRMVRETFPNVVATANAYGLTESSSVATMLSGPEADLRPGTVGRAMPVVDLKVVDADGDTLPPGQPGEVLIRGPIVMPGYWNRPDATAETVVDGWLHNGDVGVLDDDGFLTITDRAKDMLIRGGENVYCVEIEQRLVEHPAVADAAVVGVAHPELGEEVKAVVELAEGVDDPGDEALRQWVRDTLAEFKVPAYVERWDGKLPRNASGKLLKNVLRGEAPAGFSETM
ncbi:MAG: class I adenylate-forming enzyme family protein [Actinomycetes bacterium]